jgi:hypothetical protein
VGITSLQKAFEGGEAAMNDLKSTHQVYIESINAEFQDYLQEYVV